MKCLSTRRLTGPNRWTLRPASVGEIQLDLPRDEDTLATWCQRYQQCIEQAAAAIGWTSTESFALRNGEMLMVGLYPPIDGLYTGCELVEWAATATIAALSHSDSDGKSGESDGGLTTATAPEDNTSAAGTSQLPYSLQLSAQELAHFRELAEKEQNPHLRAMHAAASQRGIPWLHDDEQVSLGLGKYAVLWPTNALPAPEALDALPWDTYQPIPVAMLTGTNGKTTTARMLARIAKCAGVFAGNTSTDGLSIHGELIEKGDWTGPGGARQILRHPQLELAVLETARGGMLRRGLVAQEADVAVITNVSNDHLGEWGITNVEQMAEVKLLIRHGLRPGRPLVLNADCQPLVDAAARILTPAMLSQVVWFTLEADPEATQARLPGGRVLAWCKGGMLWRRPWLPLAATTSSALPLQEIPSTLGGAARHNIANAMAAVLAAMGLGLDDTSIDEGLRSFRPTVADSPGRANTFVFQGARVLVDFGHNPAGIEAIATMLNQLEIEGRRLFVLGQAGDRSDNEITNLATAVMLANPDQIVLKEMPSYFRGRGPWEIPGLLQDAFEELGLAPHKITIARSERDAVAWALSWAQPGDLLVLLIHADIKGVLTTLQARGATEGW